MTHMPDLPDTSTISLMAADQYFRAVRWNERLSEEDEVKYLERVVRGSVERSKPTPNQWVLSLARDARDRLVESYQPLVIHIVKRSRHRFSSLQFMDLVQEANIGLLEAVEQYACSQKASFPVIAGRCINDAFWHALHTQDTEFSTHSSEMNNQLSKLRRFEHRFFALSGCNPDLDELVAGLGMTRSAVENLLYYRHCQQTASLERCTQYDDGEEGKEDFTSLFAHFFQQETEDQKELSVQLNHALDVVLPQTQKETMRLLYGLNEEQPHLFLCKEVAREYGVTEAAIVARKQKAIRTLRDALELHAKNGVQVCTLVDRYQTVDVA